MNLHITKSKNAESFYIAKSYTKANGKTSSVIVRKLGTLNQLIVEHGPTRDDVLAWAKNEVKLETEKYKKARHCRAFLYALSVGAIRPKPGHKGLFVKSPLETQKLHQNKAVWLVQSSFAYFSPKEK